jgi:hypothetical protein
MLRKEPEERDLLEEELVQQIDAHITAIQTQCFQGETQRQKVAVLYSAKQYLSNYIDKDTFLLVLQASPKYDEALGSSATKEIIDKVLKIELVFEIPNFDELKKILNRIQPKSTEELGLCIACSIETARVLINGSTYQPDCVYEDNKKKGSNSNMRLSEKQIILLAKLHQDQENTKIPRGQLPKEHTKDDFFKYFQSMPPSSVFIITDEDHTFNILISNQKNIYLIDSDRQDYRQIKNSDELPEYCLGDGESRQSIFYISKVHPDWNETKKLSLAPSSEQLGPGPSTHRLNE